MLAARSWSTREPLSGAWEDSWSEGDQVQMEPRGGGGPYCDMATFQLSIKSAVGIGGKCRQLAAEMAAQRDAREVVVHEGRKRHGRNPGGPLGPYLYSTLEHSFVRLFK